MTGRARHMSARVRKETHLWAECRLSLLFTVPKFEIVNRFLTCFDGNRCLDPPSSRASKTSLHYFSRNTMARGEDDSSMSPLMLDDSLSGSSTPTFNSPRLTPLRFVSSPRRLIAATFAVFSVLSFIALSSFSFSRPHIVSQDPVLSSENISTWDRKSALLGPPTRRFRGSFQGYPPSFPPSLHGFIQITFVMTHNT